MSNKVFKYINFLFKFFIFTSFFLTFDKRPYVLLDYQILKLK